MRIFNYIIASFLIIFLTNSANSTCPDCCKKSCGIKYCDSSAGRFVCNDGSYSTCYCTRHAVMDLQRVHGCCLWQGGILVVTPEGLVICNNGGISEICSYKAVGPAYSSF